MAQHLLQSLELGKGFVECFVKRKAGFKGRFGDKSSQFQFSTQQHFKGRRGQATFTDGRVTL